MCPNSSGYLLRPENSGYILCYFECCFCPCLSFIDLSSLSSCYWNYFQLWRFRFGISLIMFPICFWRPCILRIIVCEKFDFTVPGDLSQFRWDALSVCCSHPKIRKYFPYGLHQTKPRRKLSCSQSSSSFDKQKPGHRRAACQASMTCIVMLVHFVVQSRHYGTVYSVTIFI